MNFGGYHILLVPKDTQKTKRFRVSKLTASLLVLAALLFIPLLIGSFVVIGHYQNKVFSLQNKLKEGVQLADQKEEILKKLANLEKAYAQTDESLTRLKQSLDIDFDEMQSGLGPVDKTEGKDEKFSLKNKEGQTELAEADEEVAKNAPLQKGSQVSTEDLMTEVSDVGRNILSLQSEIDEMYKLNEEKIRFLEATPNHIPVDGWITSTFGFRKNPVSGVYKMHEGVDIAAPIGTPVYAPADGKVVLADMQGGYGRKIIIEHGYGVTTVFAHGSNLFVKEGEEVKKGQKIAAVGSTGSSTGPHLHYEVHIDGIPTDPMKFIIK